MKKSLVISALALAGTLVLAGCGEMLQDAPVNSRDTIPADVYNMPDGFANFATKCDKSGNRVYTIWHGDSHTGAYPYGAIAVVPQDPTCASQKTAN